MSKSKCTSCDHKDQDSDTHPCVKCPVKSTPNPGLVLG